MRTTHVFFLVLYGLSLSYAATRYTPQNVRAQLSQTSFSRPTAIRLSSRYQRTTCLITPTQAEDLRSAALRIQDLTREDEPIILAGQSPAYLRPFLEQTRTVHQIAFSGYALCDTQALEHYRKYLKTLQLDEETIKKSVIVDYTRSFYGSTALIEILRKCSDQDYYPMFLNLVGNSSKAEAVSRTYAMIQRPFSHQPVLFYHAEQFANDDVPRCIPYYPYKEWGNPPNMDDPGLTEGKECMRYLENFAAQYPIE